jgi:glycosyltransferase involved in cell wall biosynthesis
MKILFLTISNPDNKAGLFYSTNDRIRFSSKYINEFKIININFYDGWILKLLKILLGMKPRRKHQDSFTYDGLKYNNFWIKRNVFSAATPWGKFDKFRIIKSICNENYISGNTISYLTKEAVKYDIIMAHYGYPTARIAMKVSQIAKIPYCATYHGSDINIFPFKNKIFKLHIKEVLYYSSMNFMVSKSLYEKVTLNFGKFNMCISPNGISENLIVDRKLNKSKKITLVFIGALNYVKRADKFAEIIKNISLRCNKKLSFLIIGDGEFKEIINENLNKSQIDFKMVGAIKRNEVIKYLSYVDYLLLPSRSEGLPLVLLEAIANKVIPITSNVGGIKEILNDDFLVDETEKFVDAFSKKVIDLVNNPKLPKLNLEKYFWSEIMKKEIDMLKNIINEKR